MTSHLSLIIYYSVLTVVAKYFPRTEKVIYLSMHISKILIFKIEQNIFLIATHECFSILKAVLNLDGQQIRPAYGSNNNELNP